MGSISINDVRRGKRDTIIRLLKALRAWEEKRHAVLQSVEPELIEWANSHLSSALQITSRGSICGGLELLRIAESIKGLRRPIAPDSDFPRGPNDDKLDGLFALFDFLLDNDVKMGTIGINDVRLGKRDKIIQLLKALRAWEEKRHAVLQSIGKTSMQDARGRRYWRNADPGHTASTKMARKGN